MILSVAQARDQLTLVEAHASSFLYISHRTLEDAVPNMRTYLRRQDELAREAMEVLLPTGSFPPVPTPLTERSTTWRLCYRPLSNIDASNSLSAYFPDKEPCWYWWGLLSWARQYETLLRVFQDLPQLHF